MKRNLSGQAIRAMAIGMAVTLGSATAFSGVLNGGAVEVYAADFNTANFTATAEKGGTDNKDLVITLTSKDTKTFSGSGNLTEFEVKTADGSKVVVADQTSVTVSAQGNTTCTITVPNEKLKNLDGTEEGLQITKLKSGTIQYNSANLDFDAGKLDITTSSALGIDKTAPKVKTAVVEKGQDKQVKITFSEKIKGTDIAPTDFKVFGGASGDTANVVKSTDISADGKDTVILTLTSSITESDTIKLSYKKSNNAITDLAGNEFAEIPESSKTDVTNGLKDTTAPTIESVAYSEENGVKKVTLTASEDLTEINKDNGHGFTLEKAGTQVQDAIKNVKIEANAATLIVITFKEGKIDPNIEYNLKYDGNGDIKDKATVPNKLAKFDEKKFTSTVPVEQENFSAETSNGTYRFEKLTNNEVALVGFTASASRAAQVQAKFEGSKFTSNKGTEYTLTAIGNGTKPVEGLTTDALRGHTDEVKEIRAKAFEGNKKGIKLELPKVTTIATDAFKGTDGITLDLDGNKNVRTLISKDTFADAKNVDLKGLSKDDKNYVADKLGYTDIKIDGDTTTEINKDNANKNNGSSSGGGYSGGTSGGAVIGSSSNNDSSSKNDNTIQPQNNNNMQSQNDMASFESKQLSFDEVKLPSSEGEAKMFSDVSGNHWAKAHIDKLSTAGVINGANGMFNPNAQTKRADVTVMLVKLLGLQPEANNRFTDVDSQAYYAPYVGAASTYGIVNGSNGMFNPESVISRQDTMVMVAQILKGLDLNVNADASALSQFNDVSKVAPYANESVAILVNSGIIAGNNGKLNPTAPVTRAEMVTIMSKLYDVLGSANK